MPKRKVTYRHYVAVVAVAGLTTMIVWASGAFSRAAPTPYNNQQLAQRLAVPAYINPADDPATWQQLVGSGAGTVGLVVANVDSGPGSAATAAWSGVLHNAHAAGMKVLGYVDTGYLGSPSTAASGGLPTRSGDSSMQAWLGQAEADVDLWYEYYGPDLDGIFFDEAPDQCGTTLAPTLYADGYAALDAYVKQAHPGALTALNPGQAVPRCFEDAADVLVTFEGSYGDYTAAASAANGAYQPLTWTPADPQKIWHIVYGVTGQDQMEQVMALSKSRNAGYVYVTDDLLPNPYDTLPPAPYWADEQVKSYPYGNPG
jgi:hypothetical protein